MIVKVHPLMEILSAKLFGIESVPKKEQGAMVRRAIKAAVAYHDKEVEILKGTITELTQERDSFAKKWQDCMYANKSILKDALIMAHDLDRSRKKGYYVPRSKETIQAMLRTLLRELKRQ